MVMPKVEEIAKDKISVRAFGMFPSDSKQVIINGKSFQNGAQVSFGGGVTVSSVS
jgi:hypothetical protein